MKYISKKVINGSRYYYLQYQRFTKVLGSFIPNNVKELMREFFHGIAQKKTAVLPEEFKHAFPFGGIDDLEQGHYSYLCLQHDLFRKEWNDFQFWFTIFFTFNSNRAEGSKVSRPKIEAFAKAHIRKPKTTTEREIFNSFQALQFAFSDEMKWNLKSIKKIHFLLFQEISPLEAGQFKNENNVAPANQPTADFREVNDAMKRLIFWLQKGLHDQQYSPLLAIQFYVRFERIHSFLDGNGRVGRILFNSILHHKQYLPVIFFTGSHSEHCDGIQKALEGRWGKIKKHLIKQLIKTQELSKRYFI